MKTYIKNKFARVEKIFTYNGHECIVIFTRHGYRCGYVSVKNDIDCEELNDRGVTVHGGLTFNGKLPYNYGQSKNYYIGFDCGHCGDREDYLQAYKYGLLNADECYEKSAIQRKYDDGGVIRSIEYVTRECIRLVDWLSNVGEYYEN